MSAPIQHSLGKLTEWLTLDVYRAMDEPTKQRLKRLLQEINTALTSDEPATRLESVLARYDFRVRAPEPVAPVEPINPIRKLIDNFFVVLRPDSAHQTVISPRVDANKVTYFDREFHEFSKRVTNEFFADEGA